MHTKTIEGLAGASTNMKMLNTPFRVYKEARRRGDTAVMDRAMGYVDKFAGKAEEYQKKAEEGMKEDAKEAREKAELEQENTIRKRKEECEEMEKRIAESRNENADTVEISESQKAIWGEDVNPDQIGTDSRVSAKEAGDTVKMKPVIYTKTGEAVQLESGGNIAVSV